MSTKHVVILKNDAVGDLVHSLKGISNIINDNEVNKITIFISKLSKKFDFLFKNFKINTKVINYNLTVLEKLNLFLFLLTNRVDKIYILSPKKFYYYLPLFFFRTKFYALCVDNVKGYKRPSTFLRKFLFKYVINDRSAIFKRKSTAEIQNQLTKNKNEINNITTIKTNFSQKLKENLPKEYIYFHAKRKILDELGWGIEEIKLLCGEILKYSSSVVITKDIELDRNTEIFKDNFNSYDFKTSKFINNSNNVLFFDNIDGEDLYNVIRNSKKVIAFHGMMTNIASINQQKVLDLFHCNIKNWDDYRNYRNSFYEFKPTYVGYDFIIPNKNINKTINKIKFSLKK
tara:strand:- start:1215 stop:2246 length:1032 start_codon:yes stop_codon:yes gene_type:complete